MVSINCFVLNRDIAKELGKRENESDLEFYHKTCDGKQLTFMCPVGFPEKTAPLLQALHLSECALLYVDKIDASLGEVIIAIDAMGIKKGFVIISEFVDEDMFWKISEGTCVKDFEKIEQTEILEKVSEIVIENKEGPAIVDLDGMFNVKSVGTVALGFITQGKIQKFTKMKSFPKECDVLVKSIQRQDKTVNTAEFSDRVGLSIKGFELNDFSRGVILTDDKFKGTNEFEISFDKNKFCKKELKEGMMLHLQCRLQHVGCTIKSINPLKIETGKPIAIKKDEKVILIDINANPRIIGKGICKS